MRAVVIHAPHDLRIEGFPGKDAPPGPGEVRVKMAAGGICGSDLHYYHHGGFGVVRVREPMALGHEAAGHIEALGEGVTGLAVGDLVAVNPSRPCGVCPSCQRGMRVHCEDMRFNGSAMRLPHEQGLFREHVTTKATQAFKLSPDVTAAEAAFCEPLSVALHAVAQAGDVKGKTVLVSGSGPIGLLVGIAARVNGAKAVIATDITAHSLDMARKFGCEDCIDVSAGPEALAGYTEDRGKVDVIFECSGNARALAATLPTLRPKGRIVLVGLGGDVVLPMNTIVVKEQEIVGTFRFDQEFGRAAELISTRAVDLRPMITALMPMKDAVAAFDLASDRTRATKVVLDLS
jgi:L-idonate 5-dehydrogenase